MKSDFHFFFHKSQREQFRDGKLVKEWLRRYPLLFDKDDERILRTEHQRQYNFVEWLAAILLFESTGYLSLVAKYTAKSHPLKHVLIRNTLPPKIGDWVFANESGQPDLFVYSSDYKDWFFCEVKGPSDIMRKNQEKWRADFESFLLQETGDSSNRYNIFKLNEISD